MDRRSFLRQLGFLTAGFIVFISLKSLSYLSRPQPKRVLISREELEKIKGFHLGEDFILIKEPDKLMVFSRRCPHFGCKLNYDPQNEIILCPCHQSKFTLKGKFITGPAKKDLKVLPFDFKEGGIEIEIS